MLLRFGDKQKIVFSDSAQVCSAWSVNQGAFARSLSTCWAVPAEWGWRWDLWLFCVCWFWKERKKSAEDCSLKSHYDRITWKLHFADFTSVLWNGLHLRRILKISICLWMTEEVGETSERRGGAHMGFQAHRYHMDLNWTDRAWSFTGDDVQLMCFL